VAACWRASHDLDLNRPLELDEGGTATALEIQGRYLEWLAKYAESELDDPVWTMLVAEWERTLNDLETDPGSCSDRLDWVAKQRLLSAYVDRDSMGWDHAKIKALALQYHDVDPASGLYHRLAARGDIHRLFTDDQIIDAVENPPTRTRAYFRGRCVSRFPDSLVAANWDSLVFDTGESHLKRVPMMEPLRGDESLVGPLLESAADAAALIEALGG
jgi:Pup amidohydrolase